jgi:hypothetical protein
MALLEEAVALARSKKRGELIHPVKKAPSSVEEQDKVFLITTYHPVDQTLKGIVFKNWDLLGKSPTTSTLHQRRLMLGDRRPKYMKELLVKANVPYKAGDEDSRPLDFPPLNRVLKVEPTAPELTLPTTSGGKITKMIQKSMKDFFPVQEERMATPSADPKPAEVTKACPYNNRGDTKKQKGF